MLDQVTQDIITEAVAKARGHSGSGMEDFPLGSLGYVDDLNVCRIVKFNDDKQLVFGWASISTVGGEMIVDKQGDMIASDTLEDAAYDFVLYHRTHGDMHERMGTGRLIESMMFTLEKQQALGIDLGFEGWWTGFKIDDRGVWKRIRSGELPEFSIGGKASREPVEA